MKINLVASYIGDSCEQFLDLSFESIIDVVEKIVFVWGMECQKTKAKLDEWKQKYPDKFVIIESKYDQKEKKQNGRQRNIYLDYLKKNYDGYWAIVLDPDEIIQYSGNIKILIEKVEKENLDKNQLILTPHMRHLIQDLSHEDTTLDTHFGLARLFKVTDGLYYPETEHTVLHMKDKKDSYIYAKVMGFTIWHLGYIPYVFDNRKRYICNLEKSEMHAKEYLDDWYLAHITGRYRANIVLPEELPLILKKHLFVENLEEMLYFKARRFLELKHYHDVVLWKRYFKINNDKKIIFVGCGCGHRIFTATEFGINAYGFDISKYAIETSNYKDLKDKLKVGDVTESIPFKYKFYFVACKDILEHLEKKDLDNALKNIYNCGEKHFLFIIPFIGNPDVDADMTHKIKETKEWWLDKLKEAGFKIKKTPEELEYESELISGQMYSYKNKITIAEK